MGLVLASKRRGTQVLCIQGTLSIKVPSYPPPLPRLIRNMVNIFLVGFCRSKRGGAHKSCAPGTLPLASLSLSHTPSLPLSHRTLRAKREGWHPCDKKKKKKREANDGNAENLRGAHVGWEKKRETEKKKKKDLFLDKSWEKILYIFLVLLVFSWKEKKSLQIQLQGAVSTKELTPWWHQNLLINSTSRG